MARKAMERPKTRHKDTPPHIVAQGLYDGEWGSYSRLPLRALIRPEIVPLKVNVLGVLFIQTFPFETELAVVMRKLKRFESYGDSASLYRQYDKRSEDGSLLVTEVMTSNSIANKLFECWMEDYAESGYEPDKTRIKEMKKARQQLRKVFEVLEADGWIERARLNCKPQQLLGLGYEKAVESGLLTPLHKLELAEKRKLGDQSGKGVRVGIFLLARPKPAKTYGERGPVADFDYRSDSNSNHSNTATADQLFFAWSNEFGIDAEVLKKHPELHREMEKYVSIEQRVKRDEDARKRQELKMRGMAELIAREAGSKTIAGKQQPLAFAKASTPQPITEATAEEKLVSQPRPKTTGISSAQFNEELCVRFHAVHANVPTQRQTDALFEQLGAMAAEFLGWLTANEMASRRPRHGGVLPHFLEEFRKIRTLKAETIAENERPRRREATREEDAEALRWIAENDPDPKAREYAQRQIRAASGD